MASTEPHSPNLLCSLVCSPPRGHRDGWRLLPHGPPTPSSDSPFLLLPHGLTQICFFLGSPVPWSDRVSTGGSRAGKTWAWDPHFWSLFALTGWRSICSKIVLKNQQKQDPEKKTKSGGERATLLFTAPRSAVGRWCDSKRGGGRAPRGSPAGASRPPGVSVVRLKELASAAVPWVLSFPRTHLRPHLKGLFRFTSLFVFLYMRAHVHVYVCAGGSAVGRGCVRIHICLYVSLCVCVCVCMCVRGCGRELGDRLCSGWSYTRVVECEWGSPVLLNPAAKVL